MVKAKELWAYLCVELKYTFFSGIPCLELKSLYDSMNSETMHYIPAVDISSALGMSSGVQVSGIKSGVLLHVNELCSLLGTYNNFNKLYRIPVLLVVYCKENDQKILSSNKIPYVTLNDDFKMSINKINNKLVKEKVPCALVIREGIIK